MSGLWYFITECLMYAVFSSFHGTPEQNRMAVWGIAAMLLFAASFAFFLLWFFPRHEKSRGRSRHLHSVLSVLLSLAAVFVFFSLIYMFAV